MKKPLTIFFQILIVLIGIGTLAFLLWEPHLEGRNANATVFEIYFNDPFLAYVYIASILFFVALYQAFKVMGYVRQNKTFSQATLKSLRTIKYCMMFLIGFIVAAMAYMFIIVRGEDDIAGGVAMGLFLIFVSFLITTAASMFQRTLQKQVR